MTERVHILGNDGIKATVKHGAHGGLVTTGLLISNDGKEVHLRVKSHEVVIYNPTRVTVHVA